DLNSKRVTGTIGGENSNDGLYIASQEAFAVGNAPRFVLQYQADDHHKLIELGTGKERFAFRCDSRYYDLSGWDSPPPCMLSRDETTFTITGTTTSELSSAWSWLATFLPAQVGEVKKSRRFFRWWNIRTGQELSELPTSCDDSAFSPDSRTLATH